MGQIRLLPAERFENASFHGQIDITGHNGVQASGMRVRSSGAVTADLGVSMPFGDDGHSIRNRDV